MRKDLHLVLELARELGVTLYLGTQASLVADAGVATLTSPAPARIAAVAASSAAPGTWRLPATTRIRPLVSLSPSMTDGSG